MDLLEDFRPHLKHDMDLQGNDMNPLDHDMHLRRYDVDLVEDSRPHLKHDRDLPESTTCVY